MADETISHEPSEDPERRRRFEAALGAYFEALDAGQSPDREELLARHPDLAAELAEFFAEQDRFHRLVAPLRPESTEPGHRRPAWGPTDPTRGPGMPPPAGRPPPPPGGDPGRPSAEARDSPHPPRPTASGTT